MQLWMTGGTSIRGSVPRLMMRVLVISAVGLAGMIASLAAPAAAAAAPAGSSFSCRASAARVALNGLPVIEPFVANSPDSPCSTDSTNVLTPTTIGPVAANVINVNTSQKPTTLGSAPLANGDNATASSTVTNPTVTLGSLVIHADVLSAAVAYTCHDGTPVPTSSGEVVALTINGQTTEIPQGINQTISLGPLGTLVLNQVDTSHPGTIVRRAVFLTTPLGDVVISEATADIAANPCASGPAGGQGTGGNGQGTGSGNGSGSGSSGVQGAGSRRHGTARLEALPPAVARLIASGRCVRQPFTARVVGSRIQRVVFFLDGRQIAIARSAPFQTPIPTAAGSHRIRARVTFVPSSHTAPRNLGLSFAGCAAAAPAFTG